jgi:hypothetical protein
MNLEALVGGKNSCLHLIPCSGSDFHFLTNYSSSSDVSDRYSNLKAAWDSLMEAASHGHPRSFQVAVTVVLEQLKREELKKQNKRNE